MLKFLYLAGIPLFLKSGSFCWSTRQSVLLYWLYYIYLRFPQTNFPCPPSFLLRELTKVLCITLVLLLPDFPGVDQWEVLAGHQTVEEKETRVLLPFSLPSCFSAFSASSCIPLQLQPPSGSLESFQLSPSSSNIIFSLLPLALEAVMISHCCWALLPHHPLFISLNLHLSFGLSS